MRSDHAIWNGTSIFVGIIVSIAAFARGALLLPLLLVACSVWGLYVLHHLRGTLPAVPKKKAKAPRRTKFVVPDIEDGPLSDILLLHVNQRITAALRTAGSNITWEWATKDPLAIVKEGGRCLIRVHGLDGFESAEVVLDKQAHLRCELINTVPLRPSPTADAPEKPRMEIIRLRTKGYQTNEIAQMQNTSLYHVNTLLDNARFIVVELCRDA